MMPPRSILAAVDFSEPSRVALDFAARLAAMPPVHVRLIKTNVYASTRLDLRASLELSASHMGIVRTLADSAEAMTAFRERRRGEFHGA